MPNVLWHDLKLVCLKDQGFGINGYLHMLLHYTENTTGFLVSGWSPQWLDMILNKTKKNKACETGEGAVTMDISVWCPWWMTKFAFLNRLEDYSCSEKSRLLRCHFTMYNILQGGTMSFRMPGSRQDW